MRTAITISSILLLFAFIGFSGCISSVDDSESSNTAARFFPARTEARDKPVLLVHGFNFQATSETGNWQPTEQYLASLGWSEVFTYGYYGCDAGFDRHVSASGTHDSVRAGPGTHTANDCSSQSHTQDTPIEHLAAHWAWSVYDEFASQHRCVDVIAHSMGGLVVRYALHAVEAGLAGFPPRLCVEDAVTLGTPHEGAGWTGGLCADLLGYVQCQQMTGQDPLLSYLAQNAITPRGSTETEWTVIGSKNDAVVGLYSALGMAAHQSVMYLGANAVGHATGTSFQSVDPQSTAFLVRFRDPGTDWRIAEPAPSPIAWAETAILTHASSVPGRAPPVPTALRGEPPAEAGITPGRSLEFTGGCSDEGRDLDRGEWWIRSNSGSWTQQDVDTVQFHTDTWTKSRAFSFPDAGTFQVRFRCVNLFESMADADWTVRVDPSYNDIPTASRTSPASSSQATRGSSVTFAGACANPAHDLDHAEWWTQTSGGAWTQQSIDSVQWHADPWTTSLRIAMQNEGSHTVRLRCVDTAGAQSDADWSITVVAPAGPTAIRYAPAASINIQSGDRITFEAGCSNPDQQLDHGEWWVRTPSQGWYLETTDNVQWSSDPWNKSKAYTFSGTGNYGVRFRCVNDDGASGDTEWTVQSY